MVLTKTDRILSILIDLKDGNIINIKYITDKYKVCTKTASRDIKYLLKSTIINLVECQDGYCL